MTPEEARGLLEAATPGPWRAFMATSGQVIVDSGKLDNAGDVPLATAAPALAELVASMHYEYAVQVEKNGRKYIITDSTEGHWLCGDDHKVLQDWHSDYMEAEDYAYSWNKYDAERTGTTARIIRRLVSEPEVVE